jgi:hypothetical protein
MKKVLVLLVLLALPAARGFAADRPKAEDSAAPLHMEDLEVRGIREKPEVLYLPVHRGISLPSSVRYDLFLVDMSRPVTPREIEPQTPSPGGTME